MLNAEQIAIFRHVTTTGGSCKIVGSAGTGKSFLLEKIIADAEMKSKRYEVVAPTWIAASHLKGSSIHRTFGINPAINPKALFADFAATRDMKDVASYVKTTIRSISLLIFDECSMLDPYLLKYIDLLCKTVRNTSGRQFGGIQTILCGDFFQLPCIYSDQREPAEEFCFKTDVWNALGPTFELRTIVRQTETELVNVLQSIRVGNVTNDVIDFIHAHSVENFSPLDEKYRLHTMIFPLRREVDSVNEARFAEISAGKQLVSYNAYTTQRGNEFCNTPSRVTICESLRVMITANVNPATGVYNGAKGTITGFVHVSPTTGSTDEFYNEINAVMAAGGNMSPMIELDSGATIVLRPYSWTTKVGKNKRKLLYCQMPLILAYAVTVHKCQSATIDKIVVDLRNAFADGMVYVALSRCSNAAGIIIAGSDVHKITVNQTVTEWGRGLVRV